MNDSHVPAAQDRRLQQAPDLQRYPPLYRRAQAGETCLFCDEEFDEGGIIDGLFRAAHPECQDEFLNGGSDEQE